MPDIYKQPTAAERQRVVDRDRVLRRTGFTSEADAAWLRRFRAETAARLLASLGGDDPVMAVYRADALIKELGL
jgi:hypothetical protein